MTRWTLSVMAVALSTGLACKSDPPPSADTPRAESPAPSPDAEPAGVKAPPVPPPAPMPLVDPTEAAKGDPAQPPSGDVAKEPSPPPEDPRADPKTDPPAWTTTEMPSTELDEDLDGDGAPEPIKLWCNDDYESDDPKPELVVAVGDAWTSVRPELSEMVGCDAEVAGLARGARQLWVYAHEHDEVGAGTNYLFLFEGGRLRLAWEKTIDLELEEDGSWTTTDSICIDGKDGGEGEWTEYTTRYRLVAGKINSTKSKKSKPVPPGDCETDDP